MNWIENIIESLEVLVQHWPHIIHEHISRILTSTLLVIHNEAAVNIHSDILLTMNK